MQYNSNNVFPVEECYVGVDVHKNSYTTCLLGKDGSKQIIKTSADPQSLIKTLLEELQVKIIKLAYETGPSSFNLAWACQEAGIEVIVAASNKLPVNGNAKNDRADAKSLAKYLKADFLKSVHIPTKEEFHLKQLGRQLGKIVGTQNKQKQDLKNFLQSAGIPEPGGLENWTKSSMSSLRELVSPDEIKFIINSYLDKIEFSDKQKKEVKNCMGNIITKDKNLNHILQIIKTVPGIGDGISYIFISELYSPHRFKTPERLSSYLGLSPITKQSGNGYQSSHLHDRGQGYLRSLLYEGSLVWMKYDTEAKTLYDRIYEKTSVHKKAQLAVAHALVNLLWSLCIEDIEYNRR